MAAKKQNKKAQQFRNLTDFIKEIPEKEKKERKISNKKDKSGSDESKQSNAASMAPFNKAVESHKKNLVKKSDKDGPQSVSDEKIKDKTEEKKKQAYNNDIGSKKKKKTGKKSEEIKNKLLKRYMKANNTPFGELLFKNVPKREKRESKKDYYLKLLSENNGIVRNMERGVLLTVDYSGTFNKAFAKFYDLSDDSIKIWIDTTDHRPYCLHKTPKDELLKIPELTGYEGFDGIEEVKRFDLLQDKEITVSKIYGKTPTDIGSVGGIKDILGGAWEANIRYHHNFIYDRNLIPGMVYSIEEGKIKRVEAKIDENLKKQIDALFEDAPEELKNFAHEYRSIFYSPIPSMKRLAFDIEVEDTPDGGIPDPRTAKYRVISVSFAATDGLKRVYCLDREDEDIELGLLSEMFPEDCEIYFFKSEKDLIIETFRLIWEYPIVVTFNGDNFDNLYLYHRAHHLKIADAMIPIVTQRGSGQNMVSTYTYYKNSVHLEIYQFFSNRSIKGYAFGNAYTQNSLEEVSQGLLERGKVKHEDVTIGKMDMAKLIYYNMIDSILTLELTTFNGELMFHLLITLMRITKLPMQDLFRHQISTWIKSLLLYEHRRKNYIVPRKHELNPDHMQTIADPSIEGKGFKGAYVIPPVKGIHFNVAVMDFSSLYPSIIKTRNLSYETVNCVHDECRDNFLPNTPYWACTKRMGIFSYVVGYFRDIRVKWFKNRIKDDSLDEEERRRAKVMAAALKVFINGAYGVFGSPVFQFYCLRVAESTTAIGRFSIKRTIEKAESMNIQVLYGDSDSVFLNNPSEEQIEELSEWARKELDLDLELEKIYQFLALSTRKKNYIGVYKGGSYVEIKGLMAKKQNTPAFIKKKFKEIELILKEITDEQSFKRNRERIIKVVRETLSLIGKPEEKGGFSIEDYAITVVLNKPLTHYTKTTPQHVTAARLLPEKEQKKLTRGSIIRYVKTRDSKGVRPVEYATLKDLDYDKYKELVISTFEQVLDALQISIDEVKGVKKLSAFFG